MRLHVLRHRYGRANLRVRPFIMWVEDVIREAGGYGIVRRSMVGPHGWSSEWRRRFMLWYDVGETVASAAEMLRKWPWPRSGGEPPTGEALRALRERMEHMIQEKK